MNRTVQSRFLMRPSVEVNRILAGAIAVAQRRHAIPIHGVVILSNHYHMAITVDSAHQMSAFVRDFQSKIAREMGRRFNWRDKFWSGRYRHLEIAGGERDQVMRLRYLLENSCKEGLVASPLHWPGVHFAQAWAHGRSSIEGVRVDRRKRWREWQRGRELPDSEIQQPETLELAPIPAWSDLDASTYAARIMELIREVEAHTAYEHLLGGSHPLGLERILQQDPHARPTETKRSGSTRVFTTSRRVGKAHREAREIFLSAYATAREILEATGSIEHFPKDSFLPPLPIAGDTSD